MVLAAVVTATLAVALTPWAARAAGLRTVSRPATAALGAVGGAGAAALASGPAELVAFGALAVGAALLVVVDVAAHRLPDRVLGPTGGVLLAGLAAAAGVSGSWAPLGRGLLAALALGAGYLLLALAAPSGLGLGDVKLAVVLGLFLGWLGWAQVVVGTLAGFVLGGLAAVALVAARRATLSSAVAFGPWMVLGAAAGAAVGPLLAG